MVKEYDEVTMRQIARRAGVALGTLFLYADHKLDLLFLAVNDELEKALREAEQSVKVAGSLLEDLVAAFRPFYRYYARQPHLSRTVLREMIFIEKGRQVKRFLELRERLTALCLRSVVDAAARREIAKPQDPDFVGWVLFGVYQVELRRWLWMEKSTERHGIARLRQALELVVHGLGAVQRAGR